MANDDQQMELDMLMAMYPDHLNVVSEDPPKYVIRFVSDEENEETHHLELAIEYPEGYPLEAPPIFSVSVPHELRLVKLQPLKDALGQLCDECLGMICVSMLAQKCQEFMMELADAAGEAESSAAATAAAGKKGAETNVDRTIRVGQPLTVELFNAWKEQFVQEQEAAAAKEKKKQTGAGKGKLTGRQLFDSTLRDADWSLFETAQGGAEDDVDALDEYEVPTGAVADSEDEDDYEFDEE